MKAVQWNFPLPLALCIPFFLGQAGAQAATLTVDLGNAQGVRLVGAIQRFDRDGNLRRPVDPKAKIDAPHLDAKAKRAGENKWVFQYLPPGKYDLLIMARDPATKAAVRIEGWEYAPVLEFDPFFPPDAATDEATRKLITDHIGRSRHYENKVVPLYMGGDKKAVRVLVMLVRDKPTSYKPGVGTIRHEIWQYTYKYGGWQKEKRTRVIDRILLPVSQLRRWTWLWDARLGGIEVKDSPITVNYQLPKKSDKKKLQGLYPY
ncbi:MAG: hypothetical protein ACYSWU_05675 [Planctomycetota bacterium]